MKEPFILFKNIKKARATSGLSQKELAKRLGVSDKTVSAYETGRAIPPAPTLTKISRITGVSLNGIFGIKEDQDEKLLRKLDELSQRVSSIEEVLTKFVKEK